MPLFSRAPSTPAQRTASTARWILLTGGVAWCSALLRDSVVVAGVAMAAIGLGLLLRQTARLHA